MPVGFTSAVVHTGASGGLIGALSIVGAIVVLAALVAGVVYVVSR